MAIKVSGTTVIDDNRNANNIVNITATGNLTAGGVATVGSVSSGSVTVQTNVVSANNYSNTYVESIKTISTLANNATLDLSSFQNFEHHLANNVTYTFANPPQSSSFGFTLKLKQDAAASGYTVTWPTSVDWPSATAPTLTATANGVDIFVFSTNDGGTTFYGFTAGQAFG